MKHFWHVFYIVFSFGNQAISLPRVWARKLIRFFNMFEKWWLKCPNDLQGLYLVNHKGTRIKVTKKSFFEVNFF